MNDAPGDAAGSELEAFLQQLTKSATRGHSVVESAAGELFAPDRQVYVARAPGRLDVMGGISDYSGALVLEQPLAEAMFVVAQAQPTDKIRIVSVPGAGASGRECQRSVSIPSECLRHTMEAGDQAVQALLAREPESAWCAYVAGALVVLAREFGARLPGGVAILISSRLPEGSGVASSAALEVASLQALSGLFAQDLKPLQLALLAQHIENAIVGAPCGVMDQVTVAMAREGELVELLCQPAQILGSLQVPSCVSFFGIDSGVRHQVSGADYGDVRTAAFMGYRMLAEMEGFTVHAAGPGRVRVEDPVYGGYLANVAPSEFEQRHCRQLPQTLSGREFLDRFGGTTDRVTVVHADRIYPVRAATAHPVYENHRTRLFRQLLGQVARNEVAELLGELMFQSHASYTHCGLGSRATDRLVALARQAGAGRGILGAKITGGGSGGAVAVLAHSDAHGEVAELARCYAQEQGFGGTLFEGSSAGAVEFGVRRAEFTGGAWRLE